MKIIYDIEEGDILSMSSVPRTDLAQFDDYVMLPNGRIAALVSVVLVSINGLRAGYVGVYRIGKRLQCQIDFHIKSAVSSARVCREVLAFEKSHG